MSIIKGNMQRLVESNNEEPCTVLQNIKETVDELLFRRIVGELEEPLRHIMPVIIKTMQQIYAKNNLIVQSNQDGVVDTIKNNFQVALNLMDISNDILECIMNFGSVDLSVIPSVPVNLGNILFLTFEHCKNSQKSYNSYYKSITEILDLFRRTQEVHTKYLNFLDGCLRTEFYNESEINIYKEILEIVLKISKTLSGINMKSMADNWKSFISLVQKPSTQNITCFNLSSAFQILTEEVNNNFLAVVDTESTDSKKSSHNLKVAGFLVKVALKLFETDLNIGGSYEDIFKFWIMVYRWHGGYFQTNRFTNETVNAADALFELCSESLGRLVCRDIEFLNQFCLLHEDFSASEENFGFLIFISAVLKEISKLRKNEPEMLNNFSIVSLMQLTFNLTEKCYVEYFFDYNSDLYEELVGNVSVAILLFPGQFFQIENILLGCIVDDNVWGALIAIDVWSLILRYATENVCRSTLTALIEKIEDLKPGIFQQDTVAIRLKILVQRIFKTLPDRIRNEEMAKYNPTNNLQSWKILNLRNIPLSHRYYIEFLICDISDKMNSIEEQDCSSNNVVLMMEDLDIISYTNFNNLQINATRIIPFVVRLWSFSMREISTDNIFFRYFINKLLKVTASVSGKLTDENLTLILNQIKVLLGETLFKLQACAILQSISSRNFNSFHEKNTLFSLISGLFQILLADKNEIVVETALEIFSQISQNSNYEIVVQKVATCSSDVKKLISDYSQRKAGEAKYDLKYFDRIRSFTQEHCCLGWSNPDQPAYKKIKMDSGTDEIINNLKDETERLTNMFDKVQLNERQRTDVRSVINKLETFLK